MNMVFFPKYHKKMTIIILFKYQTLLDQHFMDELVFIWIDIDEVNFYFIGNDTDEIVFIYIL